MRLPEYLPYKIRTNETRERSEEATLGLIFLRYFIKKKNGFYGYNLPQNDINDLSLLICNITAIKYRRHRLRFDAYRENIRLKFPATDLAKNLKYDKLSRNDALLMGLCQETTSFRYEISLDKYFRKKQLLISVVEHNIRVLNVTSVPSYLFGIISTWNSKSMCKTYMDRNMTNTGNVRKYLIACPLYGKRVNILVQATYEKVILYSYSCPTNNLHFIFHKTSDLSTDKNGTHVKPISYLPQCAAGTLDHKPGFWLKMKRVWHWTNKKCYFPFTISLAFRQCLSIRRDRILLIGDSHVRYQRDALLKYYEMQIKYMKATTSLHLVQTLNRTSTSLSQNAILFLNSGVWDLGFMDLISYITGMSDLFVAIRNLQGVKPNITIIWMETAAHSYTEHVRFNINPIIEGINQWVNHHMRNIGVKIISYFDISIPMEAFTKDGIHYHVLMDSDVSTNTSIISVGGAILSILLRHLCI